MPEPSILAFAGSTSQTGTATLNEFTGITLAQGEPTLKEISNTVKTTRNLGVLPLWNSHKGEIKDLKVFELLFQHSAKLFRLWPSTIKFECLLSKHAETTGEIHKIISVGVAEIQCSKFIKETGANFISRKSTVDAYRDFREATDIDAVLCVPGQNKDGFKVLHTNVANPLNFTSFALLGNIDSPELPSDMWGTWHSRLFPATGVFFGVEMPLRTVALSTDQQQLLDDLMSDSTKVDEIPKVVFVASRREDSCGLLIEANEIGISGDIVTEDGYSEKIKVIPEIGVYNKRYSERAYEYLAQEHSAVLQHDFVRHIGTKTCFFSCHPLGLITHGFEQSVVEPVVRRIITKYFELFVNGLDCTAKQREFFERYKPSYLDKGPDFINFHDVGI